MKKFVQLFITFLFCLSANSQELTTDKSDVNLSYSAAIGQNFLANRVGLGYDNWLSEKVGFRLGFSSTDFSFRCPLQHSEDKAPYSAKGKSMSLKASLDYKASEKLLMSFTAFYSNMDVWSLSAGLENNMFYTRGFNASFRYMFREDSFIDLSLTIVDSNNPFIYYNPYMPYHNSLYDYGCNGFTSFWLP